MKNKLFNLQSAIPGHEELFELRDVIYTENYAIPLLPSINWPIFIFFLVQTFS